MIFKKDSIRFYNMNTKALFIPKKQLCEMLGLNNKDLSEVLICYDDEENESGVVGIQLNFQNANVMGEIKAKDFEAVYKAKLNRTGNKKVG